MEVKLEHRLTEVEERAKSNSHRLDEVEKKQNNLDKIVSTVAVLVDQEKRVESDVKEIKADVKTLTLKPGKRWENIVEKLIWAVLLAVVAYFLAKFGLQERFKGRVGVYPTLPLKIKICLYVIQILRDSK